MEYSELHDRLLEEARRYEPPARDRSLLVPYRAALVLWRAKSVSYEEISANFAKHGLKVSPSAVGVFCRGKLSKAEIERARHQPPARVTSTERPSALATSQVRLKSPELDFNRRSPRIARDDY
ncbi:MAG TPA: hypothetical protein VG838_08920 [Opitutaceae bacterium]|nr:hypothetical protein [Opitutaceae bacterium]